MCRYRVDALASCAKHSSRDLMEITIIDHRHNVYMYELRGYILYSNAPIYFFPDPVRLVFCVHCGAHVQAGSMDFTFTMKERIFGCIFIFPAFCFLTSTRYEHDELFHRLLLFFFSSFSSLTPISLYKPCHCQ